MRSKMIGISALVMACLCTAACSSYREAPVAVSEAMIRGTAGLARVHPSALSVAQTIAAHSRALAFSIIRDNPEKTVIISPPSLATALSMLGTASQAVLDNELAAILGLPGVERDNGIWTMVEKLSVYDADPGNVDIEKVPETPIVHIANQIVVDDSVTLEPTFLDNLANWYDAGIVRTDLNSHESKELLRAWIDYHTAGLIENSTFEPSPQAEVVIQNALLFSAGWETSFDPSMTNVGNFTKEDGSEVTTDLMRGFLPGRYSSYGDWTMLELSYNERLVARFVLPKKGTSLSSLDEDTLSTLEDTLDIAPGGIDVVLPRIDVASALQLKDSLIKAGLESPFIPGNLGHISPVNSSVVSSFIQQARIKVTEEKTVGAAATEIVVEISGSALSTDEPLVFRADRPFLFAVHDRETEWDLFVAPIYEPAN